MITVGSKGIYTKCISEHDVNEYASLVGDHNSLHVDAAAVENTPYKRRIVHGMLVGGLVSAAIGTQMPGDGTIYLEQDLRFLAPVFIGDVCTAVVEIIEVINPDKGIYRLDTKVINQESETVIDGYAIIKYMAPSSFNEEVG